jgi:hypothetical protein
MGMILLYVLFAKFVPIISIWELKGKDHAEPVVEHANTNANPAAVRLDGALPSTSS